MGQAIGMPDVQLTPAYFLDDNWEQIEQIPPVSNAMSDEEKEAVNWIRGTSIKIAPHAETVKVTPPPDPNFDYLKSELGMNIILPKGSINELRFNVTLTPIAGSADTVATDGFPKGSIHSTSIVGGQVRIGITKGFKLIPVIGNAVAQLLSVDLNPWDFRIGSLKQIEVAFSGTLGPEIMWYFTK